MDPEAELRGSEPVTPEGVAATALGATSGLPAAVMAAATGAATAATYERHAAEVHGFLVRVTRDEEAAADLCADAFVRLLGEERAGRWPAQPRPWLFRVAWNLAMSRGRRLRVAVKVQRTIQRTFRERTDETPDLEILRRERQTDIDRAMELLEPDGRAALLLAAQGFDGVTIASLIGRTHAATRTLMSRSRTRLRDALREGVP